MMETGLVNTRVVDRFRLEGGLGFYLWAEPGRMVRPRPGHHADAR